MRPSTILAGLAALACAVACPGAARAGLNLVQNGEFENHTSAITQNTEFGASYTSVGQAVSNWTSSNASAFNLYWFAGTATTVSANSRFNSTQLLDAAFTSRAGGGNFIGMDGDSTADGLVSQQIGGLIAGERYQASFWWAGAQLTNRTGPTTEQLEVSLGTQNRFTQVVNNASQGFTGWMQTSLYFTATGASETLSFLSLGTPNGQPPISLLDGVSLVDVPEPASLGLLGAGIAGLGWVRRCKRKNRPVGRLMAVPGLRRAAQARSQFAAG